MSDITKILTEAQGNKLKADVDLLSRTVQTLRNMDPEALAHAHSVLETHKLMKKHFGYAGGVAGVHKLMGPK